MNDYVWIADIKKPQGVKGEIRLSVLMDNVKDITKISSVRIDNIDYKVERCFPVSDDYALKLEGVNDFESASKLKNKKVFAKRESVDALKDKGNFYIEDIVGKTAVLSTGEKIGVVDDIENYGANDVVFINSPKYSNLAFANIGGIIEKINFEKNEIILNKDEFFKVCVFDEDKDEN